MSSSGNSGAHVGRAKCGDVVVLSSASFVARFRKELGRTLLHALGLSFTTEKNAVRGVCPRLCRAGMAMYLQKLATSRWVKAPGATYSV